MLRLRSWLVLTSEDIEYIAPLIHLQNQCILIVDQIRNGNSNFGRPGLQEENIGGNVRRPSGRIFAKRSAYARTRRRETQRD